MKKQGADPEIEVGEPSYCLDRWEATAGRRTQRVDGRRVGWI